MEIKICQMGSSYIAPLTFRICVNNSYITYYEALGIYKQLNSFGMNYYIKTSTHHNDYGDFIYSGTL